jgi:glyoxylase-like metal-dependent hydrolase (beta-lactamase superfamily II)
MDEILPGLHRWTAQHPEWHPGAFGAEVASFAVEADRALLLIDPLVLADDVQTALDALAARHEAVHILITIGYHARSALALSKRYDNAPIRGPRNVASRLNDTSTFTPLTPGDSNAPAQVTAHAIGSPRRTETPLHLPSHNALAFGDALVTTPQGDLRMWAQAEDTPKTHAFYRDRFAPTLQPLTALRPQVILTTHGAPIVQDAARALEDALAAPPWFHRG